MPKIRPFYIIVHTLFTLVNIPKKCDKSVKKIVWNCLQLFVHAPKVWTIVHNFTLEFCQKKIGKHAMHISLSAIIFFLWKKTTFFSVKKNTTYKDKCLRILKWRVKPRTEEEIRRIFLCQEFRSLSCVFFTRNRMFLFAYSVFI